MKKFTLRIPDELHEQVRASAVRDQRSVHGQIIWLLTSALKEQQK